MSAVARMRAIHSNPLELLPEQVGHDVDRHHHDVEHDDERDREVEAPPEEQREQEQHRQPEAAALDGWSHSSAVNRSRSWLTAQPIAVPAAMAIRMPNPRIAAGDPRGDADFRRRGSSPTAGRRP